MKPKTAIIEGVKLPLQLNFPVIQKSQSANYDFILETIHQKLKLISTTKKYGPIYCDFLEGPVAHRLKCGGGKGQMIAKAIGLHKLKKNEVLKILDATAGMGVDGFILASLGCDIVMLERNSIVYALLADGLKRALLSDEYRDLSLRCEHVDSEIFLKNSDEKFDVIYLDPMFPESKKSAGVKKNMQALRELVGHGADEDELFALALSKAEKRVVVKRAKHDAFLAGKNPDFSYEGKSNRFDVYLYSAHSRSRCDQEVRHPAT